MTNATPTASEQTTLTAEVIDAMVADRRAGCSSHYPVLLCFERTFTDGMFAGMRHTDSLPCVSSGDAQGWVHRINQKNANGKINYRVSAYTVRKLAI